MLHGNILQCSKDDNSVSRIPHCLTAICSRVNRWKGSNPATAGYPETVVTKSQPLARQLASDRVRMRVRL